MATIASNVIQFTPRATEPEAIFNEYIEGAKTLPIIAKSQIVWNDHGRHAGHTRIHKNTEGTYKERTGGVRVEP